MTHSDTPNSDYTHHHPVHSHSANMEFAHIPMQTVGPIQLSGDLTEKAFLPLATFETPLWASTQRGSKVSLSVEGGICVTLLSNNMTRSILLEAPNAKTAHHITQKITLDFLQPIVQKSSRFAKLISIQPEILGKLIYLRLVFTTGEASGHNMVTKAADAILNKLTNTYSDLRYISISGNLCADKKVSAVNGLLGRGKSVIAEITVPKAVCAAVLKTTPEKIHELNLKKNLLGSLLAGSLRSANAHFANVLLAAYLATGQDAANIVEGSQGITTTEILPSGDLYFSIKIPNLIVGVMGNGKDLNFVRHNLELMGCNPENLNPENLNPADQKNSTTNSTGNSTGKNSEKLAMIIAAGVLCCELSLLAAQTNPGELMRAHLLLERKNNKNNKNNLNLSEHETS